MSSYSNVAAATERRVVVAGTTVGNMEVVVVQHPHMSNQYRHTNETGTCESRERIPVVTVGCAFSRHIVLMNISFRPAGDPFSNQFHH